MDERTKVEGGMVAVDVNSAPNGGVYDGELQTGTIEGVYLGVRVFEGEERFFIRHPDGKVWAYDFPANALAQAFQLGVNIGEYVDVRFNEDLGASQVYVLTR